MIRSISISEEVTAKLGLSPVTFRNLGQVVVLAGPNGAGKSRYLRSIQEAVKSIALLIQAVPGLQEQDRNLTGRLQVMRDAAQTADRRYNDRIARQQTQSPSALHQSRVLAAAATRRIEIARRALEKANESVKETEAQVVAHGARLESHLAKCSTAELTELTISSPGSLMPTVIHLRYPGRDDKILDPDALPLSDARQAAAHVSKGGFDSAHDAMHVYVSKIARSIYNAGHAALRSNPKVTQQLEDAEQFNRILTVLLHTTVVPDVDGDGHIRPQFRDRPFRPAELSNGEKVLLTWAIMLHKQKRSLENAIIMLDEPENHLHPDACVQALDRLRELLGEHGQIWLATHSVPLVAYGGMESVYLVKNNEAIFARDKIDDVMASLLGGPEGRSRLHAMLADADSISASRFFAECLRAPPALDTGRTDPQKSLFLEMVRRRAASSGRVRLLDYGAGRGRLATALMDVEKAVMAVEYYAFNQPQHTRPEDKQACIDKIVTLGQTPHTEYYWESIPKLEAQLSSSFDLVVLCNVLHEIEPEEWLATIADIDQVLADGGALIVLEDLVPTIGELPHLGGYLVLDEHALKKLFDEPQRVQLLATAREGRLVAVEIPKDALRRVSPATRTAALQYTQRQAKQEITRIRASKDSYGSAKTARQHAHYTMQFANSSLALERLYSAGSPIAS